MYQYPNSDVWLSDRAMSDRLGTNGLRGVLKINQKQLNILSIILSNDILLPSALP